MRLSRSPGYKWIVAAMAFFAVFGAIGLGRFGYSAILPSMQEALGISSAAAGSLASWNLAGYTIMAVVGGVLAARFGTRIIITVGLFMTAAGMFLTGASEGLLTASAARLLTGMGNGIVLAPAMALMASWFDARRLGVATGIVPAGSSMAIVVVGPIVPQIVAGAGSGGWRWAWFFFAALALAMCILSAFILRNRPYDSVQRNSSAGRLSREMRAVFHSRYAWHLGAVYLLYGFAFLIYFTFFQKRLVADLGYSESMAGTLFLFLGAAGVISGPLWGAISDRVGRGRTMAVTCIINAVAALMFALWPNTIALGVSGFLLGLGGLSMPSLIGASCGDEFGPVMASASLGFVTVFIGIGQAVGPYVGGFMADQFGSLAPSYLLSTAIFVIGAVVAFGLRDARKNIYRRRHVQ